MTQHQIEQVSVSTLIPYARNSRTHSDEQVSQIAGSIREFGFTNPVLIDADGTIIAGHGRVMAAKKLGLETVPCIRLGHLTPSQVRAYVIADNKLALNAGWDDQMLRSELESLQEDGFNMDLTGFSDEELAELLEPEVVEGETDPDQTPEVPVEPITKLGDVWILGNHRLMCGDSTSIESAKRLMGDDLADLLITDPPYNVDMTAKNEMLQKAGKARKDQSTFGIQNDKMSDGDFRQFLRDVYSTANSVMRDGAVFYIWHADSEGYNFRGACIDVEWKIRQCLVWVKSVFAIGRSDYHWKHEPCLYGWKDGASHYWGSDRSQTTVLDFKKPAKSELHPTMKPVELFEYQIGNSSEANDVVLDLFGGSGTTAIACERLSRKARLMELDPKYCDVIVKRWEDFTGKKAVLEKA
ncbi:MAG: site-specific DNA-methyltransferase [Caulobacteraceae bacterium]|nr:site-specific DNA-methyltransferase [Caulobacteraceae bacterium]